MLKKDMYVRCPADWEDSENPRIFVCGQIKRITEEFGTLVVDIYDPYNVLQFYTYLPEGQCRFDISQVQRCTFFKNSNVVYKGVVHKVLNHKKNKETDYYEYWLENEQTKEIVSAKEPDIIAAFNNGHVDPCEQLKKYEFQKYDWYIGRSIVSKNIYSLEHSFYGFQELAGSKIYLLPHQINTIMRCLQDSPFRYMLADEVGMGKTIEAISILKIFLNNKSFQSVLIITPSTLKKQWENEMLFKFDISVGINERANNIKLIGFDELKEVDLNTSKNLVIIDEVHKYLNDKIAYEKMHKISKLSDNLLLLSATPVQQERMEYLELLKLLFPEKYDNYSNEKFSYLISKQTNIVQKTTMVLTDLEDYIEVKKDVNNTDQLEDLQDLFDDMYDFLSRICEDLDDEKLDALLDNISFESEDHGEKAIRIMVSYICGNYQLEGNVIRNRRKLLENDDEKQRMAHRELEELMYSLENSYEKLTYEELEKEIRNCNLSVNNKSNLLMSFFSSPWAFKAQLDKIERKEEIEFSDELKDNLLFWIDYEERIIEQIEEVLEDPDTYEDEYNSRIVQILDYIDQNSMGGKMVVFTGYPETFEVYRRVLLKLYSEENVAFFSESMDEDETELNSYYFQSNKNCFVMLCDNSGGEGRNFQCADYVIHIDIPWDANMIEQRIGRLDRLERDINRNVVKSVVVHTENTFEDSLFKFWNEGLNIFKQSLSGMEIIVGQVNKEITKALEGDLNQGLGSKIPEIIKLSNNLSTTIKKEQSFDTAALLYRPMFIELKKLVDYYSRNENALFTYTITSWASLAGFFGHERKNNIIEYSRYSFSPRAALKSVLIPPKWDRYLASQQNQKIQKIMNKISDERQDPNSIKGTFDRKTALENDYIHFFAPGDEIYECIVQNAMNSCKGQATAFKVKATINWKGFIFTWKMELNEDILFRNGITMSSIGQFKNYLPTNQIIIPDSLENPDDYTDDEIMRNYNMILRKGVHAKDIIHLGRRGKKQSLAVAKIMGLSNLEYFQYQYNEDNWVEIVDEAKSNALSKAKKIALSKTRYSSAKAESDRAISARIANDMYFERSSDDIENYKLKQNLLLESLRSPRIILESVAFVWMENDNDYE